MPENRQYPDRLIKRMSGISKVASAWLLLFPVGGIAMEPGESVPGFELPSLSNGQPTVLADYKGKVVFVDFWASWCGPCRESLPLYEDMKTEFPAERFEIVAINLDEDRDDAVRFLDKHPVSYTILLDPAGTTASRWQIQAMPSAFLLDHHGKAIKAWAGFTRAHLEEIKNEVRAALY